MVIMNTLQCLRRYDAATTMTAYPSVRGNTVHCQWIPFYLFIKYNMRIKYRVAPLYNACSPRSSPT